MDKVSVSKWLIILVAFGLSGCAAFTERSTGVEQGELTDCPSWPRCVSSAETAKRRVEPLTIRGDVSSAWQAAVNTVTAMEKTTVATKESNYLHAEIKSPWNFYTDDFELLLKPLQRHIEIRSSGRIGYFDFHVNRDRVEALRANLAQQGVVKSLADSAN